MKVMNSKETAKWLSERDNFLILTHCRPDGDTLGSAAALAHGLRLAGKTAFMLENPETTARYLPFVRDCRAPEGFSPDFVISADIASADLLPDNAARYAKTIALSIDHHPSNSGYAELTCLNTARAACGEIVYDVLKALPAAIDRRIAALLYIALSTDTGCFSYENTGANTLLTASRLVRAGAPAGDLNRVLFRVKSRGRIAVEGMINTGMEFYFGGAAAIVTVTNEMMAQAGAVEDDMDNVASIPLSIEGVSVGVTVRELSGPGDCKVSVRTSPAVSANDLCARFGGGGHAMAAGFTLREPAETVKNRVIGALRELLPPALGK